MSEQEQLKQRVAERHEATVPLDAERVERAAKALWDYTREGTDWEPWDTLQERYPSGMKGQAYYRDIARAALAAAGPEADWLDAGLSGLPKRAWINTQCNEAGCVAVIQMPRRSGARFISGTGSTRTAALKDAIATALAAKQEGAER